MSTETVVEVFDVAVWWWWWICADLRSFVLGQPNKRVSRRLSPNAWSSKHQKEDFLQSDILNFCKSFSAVRTNSKYPPGLWFTNPPSIPPCTWFTNLTMMCVQSSQEDLYLTSLLIHCVTTYETTQPLALLFSRHDLLTTGMNRFSIFHDCICVSACHALG